MRDGKKCSSIPLFRQERSGVHFEHEGCLAQVAQVHVVVAEILKILVVSAPDLGGGRLAAAALAHLPDELVIAHSQCCCQFLNPAAHISSCASTDYALIPVRLDRIAENPVSRLGLKT